MRENKSKKMKSNSSNPEHLITFLQCLKLEKKSSWTKVSPLFLNCVSGAGLCLKPISEFGPGPLASG